MGCFTLNILIFVMCFVTDCQRESLLGSKTLGTKCIRTSICNVLANHDQNLESRFRLLKVCLFVKLESSNRKLDLIDRTSCRLFFYRISNSAQAHMTCRVLCFASSIKGKTLARIQKLLICYMCESSMRSKGVYLYTHLEL